MKVWISIDMEGIANVVDRDQLLPDGRRYERARMSMMQDLQAVLGALRRQPDVESIVVNDSHDGMLNVLAEEIPDGVRLISGGGKPWSMNQGVDQANVAFYVGYHARAGTPGAIMDHTYAGEIANVRLNGYDVGETGINAALAGAWGVPVAFVSGDDKACREAQELLSDVVTVTVKEGLSRRSALLLPRAEADRRLAEGVEEALRRVRQGHVKPWTLTAPITVEVELMTPDMVDRALYVPGAVRKGGRSVTFVEPTMEEAFRAFYTTMVMASGRPLY
ncbi:M55 family metallopeptidase [Sulfobacillus harzensis]|uniref:M55 family metallopeptidase n=1 Tax=Sulfobacillus harzensis TaxID=2729629 RepID=A0A7Y0L5N0_9FIRM|nr:M55 family metallopeptidase [Sulfobacillus harzensis]NMP22344.1 M55 family metallopeptidase [Sulfobacillus harzensis]